MADIAYTRRGRGSPPIVFVHGFGCARADWDAQVAHLAPRHETVAVDLGGHGETPGRPEHKRIETHGREVAELVRALGLPPAILVGHSMGCRVVAEAARSAPESVAGLVLVDGSRLGAAGSKTHEMTRDQIAKAGYDAFIRPLFTAMFSPAYDKAKAAALTDRAAALDPAIGSALFADIGRWDAEHMDTVYAGIRVPLLVIQSTYQDERRQRRSLEPGQTTPYLDFIRSIQPGARLETVPGVGHFPQLERPEAVNALLDAFATDLRG